MKTKVALEVYERHGWACAWCYRAVDLEIHHKEHKGMGGRKGRKKEKIDRPENLILLCAVCHDAAHGEVLVANDGFCCKVCLHAFRCTHKPPYA